MGMLVAWAQGLLGRKRIGPLHMDFLWVISSARVGSEAVDSRVEDFASSLPALFTIYVLESARSARVRFREKSLFGTSFTMLVIMAIFSSFYAGKTVF